jgi:Uma2 family endonuclease
MSENTPKPPLFPEFSDDQMHYPAPDFIVEILSPSTEDNDRGVKFVDYAAHGVGEYWIVDPTAETVEQYQLVGEIFDLVVKVKDGPLASLVIPDFTIPVRAIFDEALYQAALRKLL